MKISRKELLSSGKFCFAFKDRKMFIRNKESNNTVNTVVLFFDKVPMYGENEFSCLIDQEINEFLVEAFEILSERLSIAELEKLDKFLSE